MCVFRFLSFFPLKTVAIAVLVYFGNHCGRHTAAAAMYVLLVRSMEQLAIVPGLKGKKKGRKEGRKNACELGF